MTRCRRALGRDLTRELPGLPRRAGDWWILLEIGILRNLPVAASESHQDTLVTLRASGISVTLR